MKKRWLLGRLISLGHVRVLSDGRLAAVGALERVDASAARFSGKKGRGRAGYWPERFLSRMFLSFLRLFGVRLTFASELLLRQKGVLTARTMKR